MIHETIRDYTIISKLGEGGMGEVWLAEHRHLGNRVAIKVLAPYLRDRPDFSARFLMEARGQARLNHPHIIGVKDFFEAGGNYYMVTEYCPGRNLHELIQARGILPEKTAINIIKPVLSALNHAHSRGVVHRDIKPANLMVTDDMEGKVMDFGLAIVAGVKRRDSDRQIIGSPHYMSPEQIRDPATSDHRIDTYAMGIVLYEMLTTRVPFDGHTSGEIQRGHLEEKPISPRTYNPMISKTLNQIILKAVEKDPEDRFAGCGEFLEFIDYLEQEGAQPEPQETGKPSIYSGARPKPRSTKTPVRDSDSPGGEPPPHPLSSARRKNNSPPPATAPHGPSANPGRRTPSPAPKTRVPSPAPSRPGASKPAQEGKTGGFPISGHQPTGPGPFTELVRDLPDYSFIPLVIGLSFLTYHGLSMLLGVALGVPLWYTTVQKIFFGGFQSPTSLTLSLFLFSATISFFHLWRAGARGRLSPDETLPEVGRALAYATASSIILPNYFLPIVCYGLAVSGFAEVHQSDTFGQNGSLQTEVLCFGLWLFCVVFTTWLAHQPAKRP